MKQQTITINGVLYDATTGMRLENQAASAQAQTLAPHQVKKRVVAKHSAQMHARQQRSEILNRRVVAKHTKSVRPDVARSGASIAVNHAAKPAQQPAVTKHPLVSKFGDHNVAVKSIAPATKLITPSTPDIAPQPHMLVEKAEAKKATKPAVRATAGNQSADAIKKRTLSESLQKAPAHNSKAAAKPHKTKLEHKKSRAPRFMSLASASLALLLLAGYFTYINMPNISVRVAASQAGINASYPSYHPDGYNLSGPIAYNTGQVSMKFASTGGPQSYTLTQTRSNWDSSAVEQNYAQAKWGDDVTTTQAGGLKVYQHGSNAAWVNGGILYTVSGDAPLSSSQITQLATSM